MVATSDYRGHLYDDMDSAGLSGGKSIYEPEEKEAEEMSDYPNVDAFTEESNYGWDMARLRLEVAAMLKQLEAQKQCIASLTKVLADALYQHQLSQLREQLKKEKEKMSGYPNIDALVQGRVSGETSEWPMLRNEVAAMQKQLEAQGKGLQKCNEEILSKSRRNIALKDEVDQLQVIKREISDRASRNYEAWEKNRDEVERLKKQLSGLCQPIAITDEMVAQANKKIKELKQLLNNQASTIAKLRQDARMENTANEQLEEKRKTMVATRDEVIANKDEEIEELKRRNANQVFNCRSLREGKIRLREEIKQLSAELVETQKDVSFLCVKELREKIKQLRRQRDCLHKYFGIGLYVKMPDDLVEVLFEIDEEDKDGTPAS